MTAQLTEPTGPAWSQFCRKFAKKPLFDMPIWVGAERDGHGLKYRVGGQWWMSVLGYSAIGFGCIGFGLYSLITDSKGGPGKLAALGFLGLVILLFKVAAEIPTQEVRFSSQGPRVTFSWGFYPFVRSATVPTEALDFRLGPPEEARSRKLAELTVEGPADDGGRATAVIGNVQYEEFLPNLQLMLECLERGRATHGLAPPSPDPPEA